MRGAGWMLIVLGILFVLVGLVWNLLERFPFWGRLPGDIRFEGRRVTFYAPIATCLLVSLLLTVLLNVVLWFLSKK